jgi:hypothetical protein
MTGEITVNHAVNGRADPEPAFPASGGPCCFSGLTNSWVYIIILAVKILIVRIS